jgi:hypothetical protein
MVPTLSTVKTVSTVASVTTLIPVSTFGTVTIVTTATTVRTVTIVMSAPAVITATTGPTVPTVTTLKVLKRRNKMFDRTTPEVQFTNAQAEARGAEISGDFDAAYQWHLKAISYTQKGYYTFHSLVYPIEEGKPSPALSDALWQAFYKLEEVHKDPLYHTDFGYGAE